MRKRACQWRAFAKFCFRDNENLLIFSCFSSGVLGSECKMSTFSNAPHQLTKDQLKSALKANGVSLPRAEQRKAFYVELYLERLTSQNQEDEEFSSDEEESSEYSPMQASEVLTFPFNIFCCNILIF